MQLIYNQKLEERQHSNMSIFCFGSENKLFNRPKVSLQHIFQIARGFIPHAIKSKLNEFTKSVPCGQSENCSICCPSAYLCQPNNVLKPLMVLQGFVLALDPLTKNLSLFYILFSTTLEKLQNISQEKHDYVYNAYIKISLQGHYAFMVIRSVMDRDIKT